MGTKAAGATRKISYEDFEPFSKRQTEDEKDILEICVQGFKKEQLKVQTNKKGMLVVHGERPVDESKCSRFNKEFDLPTDCNVNQIRARLSHGVLSVVMPKRVQPPLKDEDSIVIKISKKRAIKVALILVAAVMLVALGTQLAKCVHRHPLEVEN